MGLFGKLFDKKECAICGEEIGLLGNRKLEDGNMCKKCAAKLSPWFDERRHSTVEQIKEQLAYREENQEKVNRFHVTRSLGKDTKVLLDEDARKFMIASGRNYKDVNPDVLDYSQITGCDLDINESKEEIRREIRKQDGTTERISYVPPRYNYEYDFYIDVHVNAPYFDNMRFRLNDSGVIVEDSIIKGGGMGQTMSQANMLGTIISSVAQAAQSSAASSYNSDPRMNNAEYAEYYHMGMEIKDAFNKMREGIREEISAANTPKDAVVCPFCGATTVPNENNCCEYCGAPVN